jgi:hypothetical protein
MAACLHCSTVVLRGISLLFCCQPFVNRMRDHLLPRTERQLINHIVESTQSNLNFPCALNHDLRSVLLHPCLPSPIAIASNVLISGIPHALNSHRQFTTSVYRLFFRTHQRIPSPPGGAKQITADTLSQNVILQVCLRDRLDSVREIATVDIDEPDDAMIQHDHL